MNVAPLRWAAFTCDTAGIVIDVFEDRIALFPEDPRGRPLIAFFDDGSSDKIFRLFDHLQRRGALFDWEVDACAEHASLDTLRLSAAIVSDKTVIIATPFDVGCDEVLDDMTSLPHEYLRALRPSVESEERKNRTPDGLTLLSAVNNDLSILQRELANKNAELRRAIEANNELLGMVAHDLRGPLHGILLNCQLLGITMPVQAGAQKKLLDGIENSAQSMSRLIANALDHAAIEAGMLQLSLERLDVAKVTSNVIDIWRGAAEQKSTELFLEIEQQPLHAHLDLSKFEQILGNLIANAIRYCAPGARVSIGLSREDTDVVLRVDDNGPGIPAELRDTLFQPFRNAGQGTAGERGTGLGLAIARKMVEGHNGTIECASEPGRGTSFCVRLPIDPSAK